jgi:hypothetical protein
MDVAESAGTLSHRKMGEGVKRKMGLGRKKIRNRGGAKADGCAVTG